MTSGQTVGGAVIVMLLSLIMLIREYYFYTPVTLTQTQMQEGVLARDPKFDETSGDSHKKYIEVQFVGSDETYRFIDCGYLDFVVDHMKQVSKGDSLVLRVEGDGYACFAWSPKLDTILSLESYNYCTRYVAKEWTPKFWGTILIISLAIVANSIIQSLGNDRFMDLPMNEVADIRLPLEFRGDFWTFVAGNSTFPLVALGLGINDFSGDDNSDHLMGYVFTVIGVAFAIQVIRSGIGKIYCIDDEGVKVTEQTVFDGLDTTKIRHERIDEVLVRAGLIERWRGLGSLRIISDKKEGDNDPVEIHIHGIPNAHHVARVIFDISSVKRGKVS
jgi:hypothetical protein